jgi:hypothetical protein
VAVGVRKFLDVLGDGDPVAGRVEIQIGGSTRIRFQWIGDVPQSLQRPRASCKPTGLAHRRRGLRWLASGARLYLVDNEVTRTAQRQ